MMAKRDRTNGLKRRARKTVIDAALEADVLGLVQQGWALSRIADHLGCSRTSAHRAKHAALERLRAETTSDAAAWRALLTTRLEAQHEALWERRDQVGVADRLLRISAQLAELWGADAPLVVHHTGGLTLEQLIVSDPLAETHSSLVIDADEAEPLALPEPAWPEPDPEDTTVVVA